MDVLECGHAESDHSPITRGYGVASDGSRSCYTCCKAEDLKRMANGQRLWAYLSSDGESITGWPGFTLARVTSRRESWHNIGGKLTRVWALDDMGQWWYGTAPGKGMYCRLRLSLPETKKWAKRHPQHADIRANRKALRS